MNKKTQKNIKFYSEEHETDTEIWGFRKKTSFNRNKKDISFFFK